MEHYTKQITEAYMNHADAIFKYCYFRISDREKALDFVAETFTRMWKFLIKGNEIHNQKTFLYTVARHIIIDEYRKKKIISLDFLIEQFALLMICRYKKLQMLFMNQKMLFR